MNNNRGRESAEKANAIRSHDDRAETGKGVKPRAESERRTINQGLAANTSDERYDE